MHRLFLVIAMYCQANSSQFNESLNLPCCQLAGKKPQVHAVGSNSLETTYILFKLPYCAPVSSKAFFMSIAKFFMIWLSWLLAPKNPRFPLTFLPFFAPHHKKVCICHHQFRFTLFTLNCKHDCTHCAKVQKYEQGKIGLHFLICDIYVLIMWWNIMEK